jgi:glycosyltransferase involved in cell wall biosynthesis
MYNHERTMNIGFDGSRISTEQRTGTENYSYELLKALIALPYTYQFSVYTRGELPPELRAPTVAVKPIKNKRLWTQAGLAWSVLKRQPDVLFIPAHTMPVIHRSELKTVVTIHDLGAEYLPQYHTFPGKIYLNWATEYAAAHATQLIAVSEYTKLDLQKRFNVSPDRVTVVYEGVDLRSMTPSTDEQKAMARKKYSLPDDFIAFVGTIQPRKNLIVLIQALSLMKNKHIKLVLAGKKGWLSDDIYEAPNKYDITERVKFLGYIDNDDKAALYSTAAITVLPSLFEGFGLPILESMACGTPVLAAKATSLPEVVGGAGLLVDPHDPVAMAQSLDRLVEDLDLRRQLQEKGFARAKEFTWSKAAAATMDVLEQAAQ